MGTSAAIRHLAGLAMMSARVFCRVMLPSAAVRRIRSFHVGRVSPGAVHAIIMGPPGSGKGTVSGRIVRDFGMEHVSSGDLLRTHVQNHTDIGEEAQQYILKGELVPDELMVDLILEELKNRTSNWLLDGFPRTVSQAEVLSKKHKIDVVVNMDVPFATIVDRLKLRWVHEASGRIYNLEFSPPKIPGKDDVTGHPLIQRDDDKPETVMARLKKYEEQTKPLIEYYNSQGTLASFSGTETNVIWPRVKKYLEDNFFKN